MSARAEKIIRSFAKKNEPEIVIKIVAAELDSTIKNLSKNVFDMVAGVEMAEPVATFYLLKLLHMIPAEKAEHLLEKLPEIAKSSLEEAVAIAYA